MAGEPGRPNVKAVHSLLNRDVLLTLYSDLCNFNDTKTREGISRFESVYL